MTGTLAAAIVICQAGWAAEPAAKPPAEPAAQAPTTRIRALHYDALQAWLRPGDEVFMPAVRGIGPPAEQRRRQAAAAPTPEPAFREDKYRAAVEALDAVHDVRLEKCLIFSTLEDFLSHRDRLPKDLKWVAYNSEPGMTGEGEIARIEEHVKRFADAAHQAKLKIAWAPTHTMLRAGNDRLLSLAKYVDSIALQHQKVLEYEGLEAMLQLTRQRVAAIRQVNPQCAIVVQVVIGRGTNEELIAALKQIGPLVDGTSIFTMRDTQSLAAILKASRGEGRPAATGQP